METINALGFCNFWGVTPAYNILQEEYNQLGGELNILISNTNDIRHILKTISNSYEKHKEKIGECSINIYLFETFKENLARSILFMHIIHDTNLSIRDRVEIFMEVYGNTLLSSRTAEYVNSVYKDLIRYLCGDTKYTGVLNKIINLSCLTYKDKDDLVDIISSYDLKFEYDIEKYRDDRLRFMYKDRYDSKDNIADWDYNMNLRNFAPIVRLRHYLDFRRTGVTFEMRINKYNIPNRTLSSYIPGREKSNKNSCLVRGFWGDLVNSPFIGYGIELDDPEEFEHFYKHNELHYKYDAQEITEFNLLKFLYRIEKDEQYDFLAKEKERLKAKNKQENDENLETIPENNREDNSNKLANEIDTSKINSDVLLGFSAFNVKIHLLTGNIETLFKKKKFQNYFDYIFLGFHSKNIFSNVSILGKSDFKLLVELNSFMACFTDDNKIQYKEKIKELAKEANLVLENTNSKYVWKFIYKNIENSNSENIETNTISQSEQNIETKLDTLDIDKEKIKTEDT